MKATSNNTALRFLASATIGLSALSAFGLGYFHDRGGNPVGYWDDADSWWRNDTYTTKMTDDQANREFLDPATLVLRTSMGLGGFFYIGALENAVAPATVRVENGGNGTAAGETRVGHDAGTVGVLDIQSGGVWRARKTFYVGKAGSGIVTNAGTVRVENLRPPICIGHESGSSGSWAQNGGSMTWDYARDIVVGQDGEGKLIALTDFSLSIYESNVEGCILAGCGASGSGRGIVEIAEGATVRAYEAYLGGYSPASVGMLSSYFGGSASVAGSGNVVLKGGTLKLTSNRGRQAGADSLWIGAAPDAGGGVRADSHGEIRGWGMIDITDQVYENKGVWARLGNGAIVADGEGVERTLDLSLVYQVTNVLSVADERTRTNGWYAVNKGAVLFPAIDNAYRFNGGKTTTCYDSTTCLGCDPALATPDLVNTVRIRAQRGWMDRGFCTAAMLLASDRTDIHAAAIPDKYLPIGFWKAGTFSSRAAQTTATRWDFTSAEIEFRYDQNRIAKPESRLVVLRWDDSESKWVRVARYDEQPADCVVSSGALTTTAAADDPWSLGLFCVAEETILATTIYLR